MVQWFVKVGAVVPWGASRGARESQKLVKVKMVVMVVMVGGVAK